MLRTDKDHSLQILNKIENFKSKSDTINFIEDLGIIVTFIHIDGASKKRIFFRTELLELKYLLDTVLSDFILRMLDERKVIGYIRQKDESGLEVLNIVEIIKLNNSILILGAGHVGRTLSIFASILGYEVTLIDDREEFLSDENLSLYNIKKIKSLFTNYFESFSINSNCAVVIVTRGHQYDETCLRKAISSQANYIGMIGSKRRVLGIFDNLRRENLSSEQLEKLDSVYAPVGIDIGAKSPQEIAISILAQVIQVMNCS